ncbi:MAG: carboxypeptidase-like regulatory domain-containing protein [Rikenellaceae bacterium]
MKKLLQQQIFAVKKMVVLLLLLTMTLPTTFARSIFGDQQKNFSIKNVSIKAALEYILNDSGYHLTYSVRDINKIDNVSIELKNATVEQAMSALLKKHGLEYNIIEKDIVISKAAPTPNPVQTTATQPKKITVAGKVLDAKTKKPITGVTVIVIGTQTGAITDLTGTFSFMVLPGAKLEFSFVGMKSITKTVPATPSEMIVYMESDEMVVEDVIITGYQKISKERATGSFATVDTKKMEVKLQPNLSSIMEGQIAGLNTDKDGNIEIRGVSTLTAETKPLIVLDGFPYDGTLESINSNNIENITVLKDGVAASIYGSRAANGVIVVTSKTGKEGKLNVSYKGVFAVTMNSKFKDFNRGTTSDFIDAEIELFNAKPNGDKTAYNTPVTSLLVEAFANGGTDADYRKAYNKIDLLRNNDVFKDVEKYIQRTKLSHTHNIGINGGGDKNLFNASVNYMDEKGSTKGSEKSRFIVDMKNVWTPKKWLSFDISTNINHLKSENPLISWNDIMNSTSMLYPYERIVDANGNPIEVADLISPYLKSVYDSTPNMLPYSYNPIEDLAQEIESNSSLSARIAGNIRVKIIKGLDVSAGGVWAHTTTNWKETHSQDSYYVRNMVNGATDKSNPIVKYLPYGDIIEENRNIADTWTIRGQITFNRGFNNDKHRVTALAGTEIRKDKYNNNRYATRVGYNKTAGSFEIMDIKSWNAGTNNTKMIQSSLFQMNNGQEALRDNRFVSYYGNGSYEFDNRYIISGSIRLDLTNFFGTDSKYRYKPLWSVGGTWKVSNEISLNEGPFLILGVGKYSDLTGGTQYNVQSPPNGQLRWEKTATTNIGLDLSILKSRVNFTIDYYHKLSTDLLTKDAIDPILGFGTLTKNLGSIRNKGVEVSVASNIINNQNFRWGAKVNYSYNSNKILDYNVTRSVISSWTNSEGISAAGYPGNAIFALPFAGLNDKGYSQGYNKDGEITLLGNLKPKDVVYMGTTKQPHDLSFTSDFTYRNFNLSFMIVAKFGGIFYRDAFHGSNYQNRHFSERWQKPGDEKTTIYPRFEKQNMDMYTFPFTDVLVESSNYMKLRDITLTYSLPADLLKKIGFSDVKVYAQTRNLFYITAKGVDIDPESLGTWSGGKSKDLTYNASFTSLPRRPEFYIGLSFNF